jgi:hypothetical protein
MEICPADAESKRIVIGLPLDPLPCAVNAPVIVPQRCTVVPGPICVPLGEPDVQFPEELKKLIAYPFAQLLPFALPVAL